MNNESVKLDQIVKSLFEVSSKAMIGVINECFNKSYDADDVTIEKLDPNFMKENLDYETIEVDIILKINDVKYHIEFQTKNDKTMEIKLLIKQHELEGEDVHKIALAMTNLTEYLNSKYIKDKDFDKEVIQMTKTLYDPVVKEEGIKEGIYKVAKALLDVLDDEMIAEKTGLSKDEVARLRQEQQEEGSSTTLVH